MDAIAVFGKATLPPLFSPPTKTSSSTTTRSFRSLNFSPKSTFRRDNLSAFPSKSHLFSKFSSSLRSNSLNNDSFIFLPHLVASLERVDQSYIMVKPDGVQRGLVGEIISRFEKKGFKLTGLKLFQCPKDLAEEHYKDLKGKSFFPTLIEYITSGPVVCMAWEGVGVVASARKLIGVTDPLLAEPGTIRGDLAIQKGRNVIHGSDSPESGEREVALWFKEGEVIEWEPAIAPWIREMPTVKA